MRLPEELQFIQNSRLPQHTTDARLDGKLCVITGTTSGIGHEAARRLAAGGARLVMVCRNAEKAAQVQHQLVADYGVSVDVVTADFQSLAEVRRAALEIREQYPHIDLLINNVGVFHKRRRLTPDGFEMTYGVDHLASFLFTRLLTPNLVASAPARVLFISSEAHRFGGFWLKDVNWRKRPYIGLFAYGAAKIAQLHTATLLAQRLQGDGVDVNVMHPGAVQSNIGMNNGIFYRLYKKYILRWFLKDTSHAADAIYYLVAEPKLQGVTGKYFNLTIEEKPAWYSVKPNLSWQVWEQSETFIEPYLKEPL